MKQILILILVSLVILSSIMVHADGVNDLLLTDAEIQKLKKYFPAEDSNRLIWKGDAITIILPLNKEKRIVFPAQVSVDVKGALTAEQLCILNNNKSVYFTALKPFGMTRIYVTLKNSHEVIFIDLMTDEQASSETQQIDVKTSVTNYIKSMTNKNTVPYENNTDEDVSFVDMIRFAWQQMYAPTKFLLYTAHYARTPMYTTSFVTDLVYGDKVIAHPAISWFVGHSYITAVLLRNKYFHSTHIDLSQDLCGDWQVATLYPRATLKPYGDKRGDSTMLFLVSHRPFGKTIGVCHGDA